MAAGPYHEALAAADGTEVLGAERLRLPEWAGLLADAWVLGNPRQQVCEARAWAWAEYHQDWHLLVTTPTRGLVPPPTPERCGPPCLPGVLGRVVDPPRRR